MTAKEPRRIGAYHGTWDLTFTEDGSVAEYKCHVRPHGRGSQYAPIPGDASYVLGLETGDTVEVILRRVPKD